MGKNRVVLNICGNECALVTEDSESYVHSLGTEVEKEMVALMEKNNRVSLTMAAIITALNYCDEMHKAAASADNLRSQIKDYLEDSSRSRLEADEARREIERMKREIQTLRARLAGEPSQDKKEDDSEKFPPLQRPVEQNLQTGSYTRLQQADIPKEAAEEGFISFFEKKEND